MKLTTPLRALALLVALLLPFLPLQAAAQATAKHYVFVMTSGAMPTAGSGLHLAIAAAQTGRSVDIVLAASALDLGRKGAGGGPVFPFYGVDGPAMLKQAIEAGARVSVCFTCLANQELDISAMLDGISKINAFEVLDLMEAADVIAGFGAPDAGTGIVIDPAAAAALMPAGDAPAEGGEPPCDPATDIDACM